MFFGQTFCCKVLAYNSQNFVLINHLSSMLQYCFFIVVWAIEAEDTDVNSNLQYTMSKVQCFTAGNLEITDCVDPFLMETDEAEQVSKIMLNYYFGCS